MGKVAEPNKPYCGGFTQGTLGGFTSQNPPLSYTLDGAIATVSDATGVLGTVDLTGQLEANETIAASTGVEYCGGKPKAVLQWSNAQVSTVNTPISYTKSFTGEKFTPTGQIINGESVCQPANAGPYTLTAPPGYAIIGANESGTDWRFISSNPATRKTTIEMPETIASAIAGSPDGYITSITRNFDSFYGDNSGQVCIAGIFQELEAVNESWNVTVNDATGQIFSAEYSTEPTNFRVTCFDYDIGEVTYACEGECPSGTEFQCRCEASNTLMCYGWDPENENVFKPLYTTSITSG